MLEKKRNKTGGRKKLGATESFLFKLSPELKERLEKKASEKAMDVSSLLRIIISEFLKEEERKDS